MRIIKHQHTTAGQALVEFVLMATLIFFILAAAVDIGLIFFNLQGLNNAAQEGAQWGSRFISVDTATSTFGKLNEDEIRSRIIGESRC